MEFSGLLARGASTEISAANEDLHFGESKKRLAANLSYVAQRNQFAARSIIEAIDSKFEQLSRFPFIGRERASLAEGLRSIVVRTYLIFYTVERDRIIIVRVIDGRMDVDEEFQR